MEKNEMTMEQIEARLAELDASVEAMTEEADVNAAIEEKRSLLERKSELEEIRQRTEAAEALSTGKAKPDKIIETKGEKKKMEPFAVDSKEYRNLWLKNLQGKLTEEERAGYTQTSTYATNAIPTEVADKMFEKMVKLAPMLSEITLLRVAGNLKFVAEGTRNAAAKHTENNAISVSADTTVAVTLGAFEFYKIVAISESAKNMSVDAFEAWLIEMLAGDIARAIDNYIINDTSNGIVALTFTTNTNQVLNTATTGYTYKNVLDLIAMLPAAYGAEATFLVNKKTLYTKIASIVDSAGRPIFVESTEQGVAGKIMGYPVLTDDYVTTANNALYLGKWTDVVGNLSQDINVISYPDYDYAQVKYRGGAMFDSKPAKGDAIIRLVSTV